MKKYFLKRWCEWFTSSTMENSALNSLKTWYIRETMAMSIHQKIKQKEPEETSSRNTSKLSYISVQL